MREVYETLPQVLVPGVAQAVLSGLLGVQPWKCVIHWRKDTPAGDWTQTLIQGLADQLSSQWNTYLGKHLSTPGELTAVDTVDIGSLAPVVGSNVTTRLGTAAGSAITNTATCTMINFKIPARYKGGHPRIYLPIGTVPDSLNNYQWGPAYITQVQQDFANYIGAVAAGVNTLGATNTNHCVPLYTYQYTNDEANHTWKRERVPPVKGVFTVSSYAAMQRFGTQRRRLAQ